MISVDTVRARHIRRAIGRAVIYDEYFRGRLGLRFEADQQSFQHLASVPHRHDGNKAHRTAAARSQRFMTVSLQRTGSTRSSGRGPAAETAGSTAR